MMPISSFLQLMKDELFDALVLADRSQRHYEAGLPEYSSSFLGTLQAIEAFARARQYRRLITYGTSMGGFPALRAGLWLGAERAISAGGRLCSHPARLTDPDHEIPAFDFLCACRPHHRGRVIAVFSKWNKLDVGHHAVLKQIIPQCVAMTFDTHKHNPPALYPPQRIAPIALDPQSARCD